MGRQGEELGFAEGGAGVRGDAEGAEGERAVPGNRQGEELGFAEGGAGVRGDAEGAEGERAVPPE